MPEAAARHVREVKAQYLSFRTVFIALANVDACRVENKHTRGKRWGAHLSLGSVGR